MTDIYATVICPADQVDTARTIGGNQWAFPRALTTDPSNVPPATDYGSSGDADAALLALIVALPGVVVNYTDTWQDALAAAGRYLVAEEI
jgi:hypothetical protein